MYINFTLDMSIYPRILISKWVIIMLQMLYADL